MSKNVRHGNRPISRCQKMSMAISRCQNVPDHVQDVKKQFAGYFRDVEKCAWIYLKRQKHLGSLIVCSQRSTYRRSKNMGKDHWGMNTKADFSFMAVLLQACVSDPIWWSSGCSPNAAILLSWWEGWQGNLRSRELASRMSLLYTLSGSERSDKFCHENK